MSDLLAAADNLPDKPTRSKLEPYADVIAALRRKRYSYVEIAGFLLEKAKVQVDPSTVWDFVKAETKRGRLSRASTTPAPPPVPTNASQPTLPEIEMSHLDQRRVVYVPPTKTATTFDPASLKTNDEVEES